MDVSERMHIENWRLPRLLTAPRKSAGIGILSVILALGLLPGGADASEILVSQDAPSILRLEQPESGAGLLLEDCFLDSSESGVFDVPRPRGSHFIAVACAQQDAGRRLVILDADGLSLVHQVDSDAGLFVRTIASGLMIETSSGTHVWQAPDGDIGSADFAKASAAAAGLPFRPGQALWPGIRPQHFRVALDPMTPLRLGPSKNAPWFERLGDTLLLHLGDGTEDGFWQVGGNLRLCVPDSRCGYAPASTVERLPSLDTHSNAVAVLSALLGNYDDDKSCWFKQDEDGDQVCFRVLAQFTLDYGLSERFLTVATGVTLLSGGGPARCAACRVELMLVHGTINIDKAVLPQPADLQTISVPMGAFGIGPRSSDLFLTSGPGLGEWTLQADTTFNDRGTVISMTSEFTTEQGRLVHRSLPLEPVEQQVEMGGGLLRLERTSP